MTEDNNQTGSLRNSKMQTESAMDVLFQHQNKQILQVTIPPNCSVCFRGRLQYSNYHNPDQKAFNIIKEPIFTKPKLETYQWKNKTQQMQVIGLTHNINRGPILFLDYSVYKESFYVSQFDIIASKYKIEGPNIQCPQMKTLILIEYKEKATSLEDYFKSKQKIALQSSQSIIEKYLGEGEEFVLYHQPLAVSQSITIEPIKTKNTFMAAKYTGPGWLFFPIEPSPSKSLDKSKTASIIIIVVVYVIVQVLLVI